MVKETREAIAAAIHSAIPNIQASAYQLANPTPPYCDVIPDDPIEYDQAMQRGMDTYTYTLTVLVGETTDIGAQQRLDRFLEPSGVESIKRAVEADRTLGGLVYDCSVVSSVGYQRFQQDGRPVYLGTRFTIEVKASGE